MPKFTIDGNTDKFQWQVTGLSSNFSSSNYKQVVLTNRDQGDGLSELTGTVLSSTKDYTNTTSTKWITCTALSNQSKAATVYAFVQALNGKYYSCGEGQTVPLGDGGGGGSSGVTVSKWDWRQSNGQASTSQTRSAANSLIAGGEISNFSYLVWNDMVDKVKDIIDAAESSWWTSTTAGATLTYANTKMTPSNKILTAARFNSLRYNIGARQSTGISKVNTGDVVYASYFTALTTAMNNWIDKL